MGNLEGGGQTQWGLRGLEREEGRAEVGAAGTWMVLQLVWDWWGSQGSYSAQELVGAQG